MLLGYNKTSFRKLPSKFCLIDSFDNGRGIRYITINTIVSYECFSYIEIKMPETCTLSNKVVHFPTLISVIGSSLHFVTRVFFTYNWILRSHRYSVIRYQTRPCVFDEIDFCCVLLRLAPCPPPKCGHCNHSHFTKYLWTDMHDGIWSASTHMTFTTFFSFKSNFIPFLFCKYISSVLCMRIYIYICEKLFMSIPGTWSLWQNPLNIICQQKVQTYPKWRCHFKGVACHKYNRSIIGVSTSI